MNRKLKLTPREREREFIGWMMVTLFIVGLAVSFLRNI